MSWLKSFLTGEGASRRRTALKAALSGAVPGAWASDHLEETLHYTGWTYCAVHALAKQASQAKCEFEDGTPAGRKDYERLLTRPNGEQSGAAYRYSLAQQLSLTGSAIRWRVENGMGAPVELYVIPTGLAIPQGPNDQYPFGWYKVAPASQWPASIGEFVPLGGIASRISGAEIDFRDVKAIRWQHPLIPGEGMSPVSAGALTVDLAEQLDTSRWAQLKNGVRAGLIFKLMDGQEVSPEEWDAYREELRARQAGSQNVGRDFLLPPGFEAVQMERTAEDMDYVDAHPQIRDANLALFHTPPIAAGITEAGNYSALSASLLQWVSLTVGPMLDLIADEENEDLSDDFDGARLKLTPKPHNNPELLEQQARNDVYAQALTVNEYRERYRNLPPVDWGDIPLGGLGGDVTPEELDRRIAEDAL